MIRVLVIGISVAVSASAGPASASESATPYFVTAKVPYRATVESFVNRAFKETVTCRAACKVSTTVLIRARTAKQLGFKNVKEKLVPIATNRGTLKARTPTKLSFVLTPEARLRLPKATGLVQIFGSVASVPTARPDVNYSVGWASTLT